MSSKIKQSIPTIKYILWFASLLFSFNVLAAGDLVTCKKDDSLESYNDLYQKVNNTADITKNIDLVYDLARTALCLDKDPEGMTLLQKAVDSGHIPATYLLGIYYRYNQTFYSSEYSTDLENIDKSIHYYTKATLMIQSLPNYPEGTTEDVKDIEYTDRISYHLFTSVPFLHFRGYFITFNIIIKDNTLYESNYTDTLEILYKMKNSAKQCLERPALSVWKEESNMLYIAQQLKCSAFLKFAEKAYPLEKQRIKTEQSCKMPLKECFEYQQIVNQINQSAKDMFEQIMSTPKIEKISYL